MRILSLISFFLLLSFALPAQNEEALEMAKAAITKMDDGDISEALELLEKAWKMDPGNQLYPYEIGYAHYLNEDYAAAVKVLKKLSKKQGAGKQVFSLLGNAYDNLDNQKKAVKAYKTGIKNYPESGIFYVELGILEGRRNNWNEAGKYWEQGIVTEPNYPSNYFHLANLFAQTDNRIWALLYGEIFMNLERNSRRTPLMSESLYVTWRESVKLEKDSATVDLYQSINWSMTDAMELKFPAPLIYSTAVTFGTTAVTGKTDLNSTTLHELRAQTLSYWEDKGYFSEYPNILLDYQKTVRDAGHFETYNYWLMSQGDPVGWEFWLDGHQEEFDAFVSWFNANPLEIPKEKVMVRSTF
ncbi:tetratricopeptide repeat protein [Neolewinella aurantiaca]|uniref:Tetratricopeptide repeat protein n=1 Tax=Neolewinella aurantiaca TaxID=2602767 RepID=A0A5C7FR34_9BACT|nr:tetratricopeptide repeat protein [Neolewinella aurantiaca]TXF90373.1 tetratricopeptide repeat protein [Neolewinella aurantiaca]